MSAKKKLAERMASVKTYLMAKGCQRNKSFVPLTAASHEQSFQGLVRTCEQGGIFSDEE